MVGSTMNRRNESSVGSLMSMPPAKFNSVSRSSASGSPQKSDFTGTDKIVGKPNAIPVFRKKPGSEPYNKEHIFAGPTTPEPRPDREKRVGSKLHSDPFDGLRQETVKERLAKRKLTPTYVEKPERSLMKRVQPNITVDKGFVAGSGYVFNGGKRHNWPQSYERSKTEVWDSHSRRRVVAERRQSAMANGASPIKHEINQVEKNPALKSPTRRDIPDWHNQSKVGAAYRSAMLGGQCLPLPAKNRAPANVHPPWHTSTPRHAKAGVKSRYQPPWHTTTPRGAAAAKMARFGRKTLVTPRGRNTPRAVGKRHLGCTAGADAPYARAATAATPNRSADYAREATVTPSASPAMDA